MLEAVHRWIWSDTERRARKLLRFGETETDGGRDLVRASEKTSDALLRRLYLEHAIDEHRHGVMFYQRGKVILLGLAPHSKSAVSAEWVARSGNGVDDLRVDEEPDEALLAFLHLSE